MGIDIIVFITCSAIITFSGTQLSRQGDKLAQLTGLSKAWIGLILMATVTSLPELVTGISAVSVVNAPDLAAGNVLGSCAFNLLILSMLDLFVRRPLNSLVHASHVVTGAFSIILLAIAGVAVAYNFDFLSMLWISPFSIVLLIVYVMAMRAVFLHERAYEATRKNPDTKNDMGAGTLKQVLAIYSFHAVVVVVAALFLPYYGERIAVHYGLSETLFGTVFLAAATSLPEMVVSVSAVRLGAPDMAMGNLLGSNVFNVALLALFDFFNTTGPIYASISREHILSVFSSILMTAIVAIGLLIHPDNKRWRLTIDGWFVLLIYVLNILMLR